MDELQIDLGLRTNVQHSYKNYLCSNLIVHGASGCKWRGHYLSALCIVAFLSFDAKAQTAPDIDAVGVSAGVAKGRELHRKKKYTTHRLVRITKSPVAVPTALPSATPPDVTMSPARFDKLYQVKGLNTPFVSFGDTVLQDYGGWRSTLASYGFGLVTTNATITSMNMLNTPRQVPNSYPACTSSLVIPRGTICAGNHIYYGQRPSYVSPTDSYLTYDLSQWGVPDGQLIVQDAFSRGNDDAFLANVFSLMQLSWYQTLFDKKVEVKFGIVSNTGEFVATSVGGSFANPFGPNASIPVELGMSAVPTASFRTTWHMTDSLYNESAVQRSLPFQGSSVGLGGGPVFDELQTNPTGINAFSSSIPGTRELFIDELGYKTPPVPGAPSTWLRVGGMYNNSTFADYSKFSINPAATRTGAGGIYALLDRQLWQQDPSSPTTAYRGIYAGVTAMYAPPESIAFQQYYEARAYWIGPFETRQTDLISLVYDHNVISRYLASGVNSSSAITNVFARNATNSLTVSYTAHLMPGVYGTFGVSYTDHPSLTYFRGEGSSLNALASLFTAF